ncbi:MAG: glycosyltransferase family 9 protein [Pseudomonadota bacterium]|nr:glycosyltransferase family 9 protein [Pseudomonadota bacterium]
MNAAQNNEHILVIKLSALGDFIQALGPMKAIRAHHPDAKITLLTTKAFKNFGEECGYFDDVWIDERPKWFNLSGWANLSRRLNNAGITRVYDFQNNDRTRFYFKLFAGAQRPEWVGTAKGGSHYNNSEERTAGNAFNGHKNTLALAGINNIDIDDLSWIQADISELPLKKPYAVLVAGCAPSRPEKRWPHENFATIGNNLVKQGIQPVLIGTNAEVEINKAIKAACPDALDLTNQTSIKQIAVLGREAKLCVTNDTGPAHIIGVTGCPCFVLFSTQGSNPDKHAPLGHNIQKFIAEDILTITSDQVWREIDPKVKD